MTNSVIAVEGLGKSYEIRHQAQTARYQSLRDVMADSVRSLYRAGLNRLRRDVQKSRKDVETFWALNDVSFDVRQGEVVGIIGRNGAGKSTLLKILSRITEPTRGEVKLRGRVASLLEVGTGFHPELTGRENIFLNGSILGMSRSEIRRRFDEIVEFSEVEKFLDTPVKRYSSGMYVRLAFAVAAHLEPEILIVDEVLAVGDAMFQEKCLGRMRAVATSGRTILFVSHNVEAINRITSRCIFLESGRVSADGPTQQVLGLYTGARKPAVEQGTFVANGHANQNRIERAKVVTSHENAVHHWGKTISFVFEINVIHPSKTLCFSFQILNEERIPVCYSYSFNPSAGWGTQTGKFSLICTFEKCRLFQGNYSITTWLTDRTSSQLQENLVSICPFSIEMGSFIRSEYEWRRGDCVYLEDSQWSVTDNAEMRSVGCSVT